MSSSPDLIELVSPHGRARVSRQGAQVLDAQLQGRPLLWLSPLALFEAGKAIRGGVPICFPWFGKHPAGLPAHGFARNHDWNLLEQRADRVCFELRDDPRSRALWPFAFRLTLAITLDSRLHFDFRVENRDTQSFDFSYALHSYFAVGDCRECSLDGLAGRLRREVGHVTTPQPGSIALALPIDANFESAPDPLALHDGDRTIEIAAEGMRSAVVWNPGAAAETVADIGRHWPEYVCVERGNIGAATVTLLPGETHRAGMDLGWYEKGR
ncbi:D-hexose-6-phosphate mutarotase [Chitinimonas arctica]|uniref:Putative glucose-6-phosphate 1-epimerase n=1 Tax=Chitinimonas arctica TaxID=2594795 RepID=A0A516SCJ5_9NEIS|nr:D-hexose-6-phosphate mutarotase [Chitinimonas arctica]QDQ25875.1 D-hexose-6-phosphate mutarotase [Chitinimonas arctica]